MGASIFFHPTEWARVAADLRARIGGGAKIGVGINNLKLCGCILVPIVDAREYLSRFPAAFEAVKGGRWNAGSGAASHPRLSPCSAE